MKKVSPKAVIPRRESGEIGGFFHINLRNPFPMEISPVSGPY